MCDPNFFCLLLFPLLSSFFFSFSDVHSRPPLHFFPLILCLFGSLSLSIVLVSLSSSTCFFTFISLNFLHNNKLLHAVKIHLFSFFFPKSSLETGIPFVRFSLKSLYLFCFPRNLRVCCVSVSQVVLHGLDEIGLKCPTHGIQ